MSDEIANLQLVIDSLARDIIKEDLSHINAADILGTIKKPDLLSMQYLLDIFHTLNQWVEDRCKSISSSNKSNGSSKNSSNGRARETNSRVSVKNKSLNGGHQEERASRKPAGKSATTPTPNEFFSQQSNSSVSFRLHMSPSYSNKSEVVVATASAAKNTPKRQVSGTSRKRDDASSESTTVRKRIMSTSRERRVGTAPSDFSSSSQLLIAKKLEKIFYMY